VRILALLFFSVELVPEGLMEGLETRPPRAEGTKPIISDYFVGDRPELHGKEDYSFPVGDRLQSKGVLTTVLLARPWGASLQNAPFDYWEKNNLLSLCSHSLHAVSGLFTFHLIAAEVTVLRGKAALSPRHCVTLSTSSAFDPLFFDGHRVYLPVTRLNLNSSVTGLNEGV